MASRRPLDVGICPRAAGAPSAVAPGREEFPGLGSLQPAPGRSAEASGRREAEQGIRGGVDAPGFGKAPS